MSKIFLSYRRSDSADATARIHDHLDTYFGKQITFRDVDGIHAGMHFPKELNNRLVNCQVAIVVIGPNWLGINKDGSRRIDLETDFIRMEVTTLLSRDIRIIPVLVMDALPLVRDTLPEPIKDLAYIHAISLPPRLEFSSGMMELVKQIHSHTNLPFEDYATTLRQCQKSGLVTVLNSFLDDTSVRDEIRNAKDLIVVMNDGRNFVNDNQEILRARLRDRSKFSHFVFYHPKSDFLPTLIRKNRKGRRQLEEMKASFDLLTSFQGHNLVLKGHHLFNPYSLTMSENYAFISPYRFNEGGALPLLKFSASAPDGYYHVLREDALKLIQDSESLNSEDFSLDLPA